MENMKLDLCKCGSIPYVKKYDSGSTIIRCECGMQTKAVMSVTKAITIWNGYKEPDLKELLTDVLKELRDVKSLSKHPISNTEGCDNGKNIMV